MPEDKAISWPLSQESSKALQVKALKMAPRLMSIPNQAPLESKAVDQAPLFAQGVWSKNEQLTASHAGHGAATVMNGLSTDCSTVFVSKPDARA
ncbi:hypothetical protein ACYZTR_04365 [Pseudomonas sp. Hz4]